MILLRTCIFAVLAMCGLAFSSETRAEVSLTPFARFLCHELMNDGTHALSLRDQLVEGWRLMLTPDVYVDLTSSKQVEGPKIQAGYYGVGKNIIFSFEPADGSNASKNYSG